MARFTKAVFLPIGQGNSSTAQTSLANGTVSKLKALDELGEKDDVVIKMGYRPDGKTIPDTQVYNASMLLLLRAAQPSDLSESVGPIFSTYNDVADFTFSFGPSLSAKINELDWLACLNSINAIVTAMAGQGPEGKFAELDGIIMDEDFAIGRFCIDKGDLTKDEPESVCIQTPPEDVSAL